VSAFFAAEGLAKRFGGRLVLQDVSFELAEGEVHGIIGPNGAGKTTCFHCLTGKHKPDGGRVTFRGRDITGFAPRRIARLGIARSFQLMNLFDDYSALENAVIATPEFRARGGDTIGAAADCKPALERAAQALDEVGLADRVSVVHWGQVIARGTPAELRANPWVKRSGMGE
jgi:branched-chain amino acid transport system ATP-binding protein